MIDLNGTQAAIRAGYSKKTANEQAAQLLAKLSIQSFLAVLQADVAEKIGVSVEWVVRRLKDISDRSMTAEPVFNKAGKPTGEYIFDSSGANRATELLGRHLGVFEKDNKQKEESKRNVEVVLPDGTKVNL